jgi:putative nucleotidyltransferase with HDIG domain
MRRILFVDDEPRTLGALARMLHQRRSRWVALFAGSGEEALEELGRAPVDVLVTEMRMPGMDGATLLQRIAARSPETIRIVLSGQTDTEVATRALAVAHQFLTKPCEPAALCEVMDRVCALRDLLQIPELRRLVGSVDALPAVPEVWHRLGHTLADPASSVAQIAGILQQDAGLTAKVLQLVNSAFFGQRRQLTDVHQATSLLGTGLIRSLALVHHLFGPQFVTDLPGFTLEGAQAHALAVARLAQQMLPRRGDAEAAFTAGLLHDVGKLILARGHPCPPAAEAGADAPAGVACHRVEGEGWAVGHAEVGAYLLGLWGLPVPVVEAVAHHHQPERVGPGDRSVLLAVPVANALVHECHEGPPAAESRLDSALLEQAGWTARLEDCRELAARQFAEEGV